MSSWKSERLLRSTRDKIISIQRRDKSGSVPLIPRRNVWKGFLITYLPGLPSGWTDDVHLAPHFPLASLLPSAASLFPSVSGEMPFFQSARRHSRQFLPRSKTVGSRESEFPLGGILSECIKANLHGLLWANELRMNGPEEGKDECVEWTQTMPSQKRSPSGKKIPNRYVSCIQSSVWRKKNMNEFV